MKEVLLAQAECAPYVCLIYVGPWQIVNLHKLLFKMSGWYIFQSGLGEVHNSNHSKRYEPR